MFKGDYSLNLINKLLALFAGFGISVILARHLGVVLRGDYAFIFSVSSTVAIVLGLGLNQTFSYYYKHRLGVGAYGIFARLYLLQLVFHSVIAGLLFLFVSDPIVALIALLLPSLVLYQQFESTLSVVNVRLKIWANLFLSVMRLVGVLIIVLVGPVSLFPLIALHAILWLALPLFYILATGIKVGTKSDFLKKAGIFKFSFVPMVTALLVVLNYNVDIVVLRWLGTPIELGLYSVAASFMVYIWALPDAVKEVVMSRVVRSEGVKPVLRPLRASIYGSLLLVLGFALMGPWFIPLAFGEEYRGSFSIALVLCIGVPSMAIYKIVGVVVLSDGRRSFYFGSLLLAVLVNTGLNLLLIPGYGAVGAAWSSVASYSLTGFLFLFYFVRVYSVRSRELVPSKSDFAYVRAALKR
ncbi:hypothetical protein ACTHQW_05980 [Dietzia maris]